MRKPPRFALGDRVTFTHQVLKERLPERTTWKVSDPPEERAWGKNIAGHWTIRTKVITEGVIVGQRFLPDYQMVYDTEYGDYGMPLGSSLSVSPVPGTTRRAWLVAHNLHRKPAYVLDEHVTLISEEN